MKNVTVHIEDELAFMRLIQDLLSFPKSWTHEQVTERLEIRLPEIEDQSEFLMRLHDWISVKLGIIPTIDPDQKTWTTKDGRVLEIKDMTTEHIENTINLLKRCGFVSKSTLLFYLTDPGPSGEMASYAFEREQDKVFSAPVSETLDWLEAELKNRKVKS
jgi:hypothetical protein